MVADLITQVTWNVDPTLIHTSWFSVRWYGLMFAIGFIVGYEIECRIYKREGAPESWMPTLLVWVLVATIVGARLGHVFFYEWSYYSHHPADIIKVWEGGLASHGGTIGLLLAIILYSVFTTRRNPIWAFDRLVVPVAFVAGLIRIGNLMNSEIFGHATSLPWGFCFVRSREWLELYAPQACHPTQIYEALCYFALFALLMWMYWKKNAGERPGLLFGVFFIVTFGSRFLIEFIKNPQVDFERDMALNMGQLLSIPFILAGVILVIYAMTHPRVHIDYPNRYAPEK